jgi:DNA-binding MarR family transcriptional regulator
MDQATKSTDVEQTRIVLGLLEYVERGGEQSQRRLASELGVALGLVNAYVRRCVRKGLVKVRHAPARRYAYYLTPRGFAEKSRLTVEYMSYSLSLFRRAKTECTAAFATARERGFARMALLGVSDLAEIAMICALDSGMTIIAVIDPNASVQRFAGAPVAASPDDIAGPIDAVLVTDMRAAGETAAAAIARYGAERVFMPALLGVLPNLDRGAA